jgi:hypothetical protein
MARDTLRMQEKIGHPRFRSFAGMHRLMAITALYNIATVLVTNDSGPAHFSAITPIRSIVLFGPETPKLYGSLGNTESITAELSCSPCVTAANMKNSACDDAVCMKLITPERVLASVRAVLNSDAEAGKAYHCNWLQGVENTTDTTHLTYLHGIYNHCPAFKPVEGDYGVKLYILEPRAKPNHVAIRERCTVLPTINCKSRELYGRTPDEPTVTLQQAIWVIPIDDTHCEEMRITVYPEAPAEQSYHGGYVKQAKQRKRQSYDRRFYGDIRGNVPLEDKAMVESQGAIVDRTLEHPGFGDRAILLLRKMIRDGVAAVANGETPKGVLKEDLSLVDLDIGIEQYPAGQVPEARKPLLAELQQQTEQI